MDDHKFFGEWVHFIEGDEQDKADAKLYLELWKKFIMRKLESSLIEYEPVLPPEYGEQWLEKPSMYHGALSKMASLGYKMAFKKKKLPGELT